MDFADFIRKNLYLDAIPVAEADIPFIQQVLYSVYQAQTAVWTQRDLKDEVPITIVDSELIQYD
ncbi:hypothetical protein [Halalkalibacter akibai]|uniref:Uncharacterized protein n=1 Tax=Halalkalibacter akibai (strain ATCC 43226 / DSM 21942 / CIP 109018 / JCM 9157 / 1139) TaxID=1236973 RepID=W4QPZ6_HALA3|nr:hypothetical protein [Halalkalibacter akibai]GAE33972.1 hypothetical protein JCM9157_1000 [Halalkalibacter akibai JCM 9157]